MEKTNIPCFRESITKMKNEIINELGVPLKNTNKSKNIMDIDITKRLVCIRKNSIIK